MVSLVVSLCMMESALPLEKLSLGPKDHDNGETTYIVLLSAGSFNPPTYMHLRLFELARDALNSEGFSVIGGYMSLVNDAYKKKGLLSAEHRITMCNIACRSSEFYNGGPMGDHAFMLQSTVFVSHIGVKGEMDKAMMLLIKRTSRKSADGAPSGPSRVGHSVSIELLDDQGNKVVEDP
ncbi:hypothetical protein AgCh_007636 [Apium graveolens]